MSNKKPIVKKWWFWLIVVVVIVGIVGAVSGGGEDKKKTESDKVENSSDTDKEEKETTDSEKDEEKPAEPKVDDTVATITQQVLLEQDGIKITATGLTTGGIFGPELELLLENTTDKAVTVQTDQFSLNGFMMTTLFSCDLAAGKSANSEITIMQADLDVAGITAIQNMEFVFSISDPETYQTIFDSAPVTLATSLDGKVEQVVDTSGQVVFEHEGLSITAKEVNSEDSLWGTEIYVFVENTTDKAITVQADSVSVNGFMVQPMFSCNVAAGKKAFDTITFFEEDLTKNNITSVDTMDIIFNLFESESYQTIIKSDSITITF